MNVLKLTARRQTAPLRWLCLAALLAIASSRAFAQLPTIITHPESQTNAVGTPVTFYVVVSSLYTVDYYWRFNGTHIPGATNDSFTIPRRAGYQRRRLQRRRYQPIRRHDQFQRDPHRHRARPARDHHPSDQQQQSPGAAANFSVVASPDPLSYQWRFNTTSNLTDATNSTLPITNVQAGRPALTPFSSKTATE